ncbi:TetR/AcrR family transcriptional regulator [Sphingobacterium bambusae]|uniref:TetR/AcrR family transcriptional regulator n=1 Tax=Sphingobacterium bambusae TaxID=662858 RepID=A0ABW6BJJ9_9SPHI|nr:helix-turn-helix domain-containing protein [Sphingobacterium bambusae]WPL49453.1 helix-turn-helix domain-containing protein [Sphingobacterium bambusae]
MPRQKEFDYDEKLISVRNLFWEKGYNATSMNDLVDTLKINRSSLYLTYGSRHDLFIKSLTSYNKLIEDEYKNAETSNENSLEAIKNMVIAVVDVILKDDKTCLVVNSSFELACTDDEVKKMISNQIGGSI